MGTGSRVAFTVLGRQIYWYGVLVALGVVLGVLTASLRERREGLPRDTAMDFALVCMPVAIVCARIYYVAFEWRQFAGNLWSVFDIRSGGLAIYGGVIGGALAAVLASRRKKIAYGRLADLVAPSLALGQAIGRWGNFCNQEAFGGLVTAARWQFFPAAVYIERLGEWHMAAFFYESVWCFGIWLLLEILVRRGVFDDRRRGDVFFWYAALYSAERAVVEGLRTDSLYWGSVRVSQALSCAMLIFAALWFFLRAGKGSASLRTTAGGDGPTASLRRVAGPDRAAAAWLAGACLTGALALFGAMGGFTRATAWMLALCAVNLVCTWMMYRRLPRAARPRTAEGN